MESSTRRPVLVIPACGKSQRFKDQGIKLPKGLLRFEVDGEEKTMIEHAIPKGYEDRTLVIVERGEYQRFRHSLPKHIMIRSLEQSAGQLQTITQTMQIAKEVMDTGVLVINCDNKFQDDTIKELTRIDEYAGAVVFKTEPNPAFGYVDGYPLFDKGKEKDPISEYAIGGAFYFQNPGVILDAYREMLNVKEGFYLTELFEYIPLWKRAVLVDRRDIFDFGTPELLASFLK